MGTGEDRISQLPDEILDNILCCLELREAVQTSVLSRRWRNVWRHMSRLTIDVDDFVCSCERCEFGEDTRPCFQNFVYKFMAGHHGRVRLLNFIGIYCDESFGSDVICFAACHGVELLAFKLYNDDPIVLSPCFYQCQQLRTLLIFDTDVASWLPFSHSSLGTLLITEADFDAKNLTGNIIPNCPSLEELYLRGYKFEDVKLNALMLKKLQIWDNYHPRFSKSQYPSVTSKIVLSTPGLSSLSLYGIIPEICLSADVSSIDHLEIVYPFRLPDGEEEIRDRQICLRNAINLLKKFHGARSLTISMKIAELLLDAPASMFNHGSYLLGNVRHLRFTTTKESHDIDYFPAVSFVHHFIGNLASLESLSYLDVDLEELWSFTLTTFDLDD